MVTEATNISAEKLEAVAFILKTIAHPSRIAIIDMLKNGEELPVGEISSKLGMEQSLTSHHLSNMKLKGILGSRREGRSIFYFLKLKEVTSVIKCMESCESIPF